MKELPVDQSACKKVFIINKSKVMTYTWNIAEGKPIVLLLHGWNGRGTQMHQIIDALLSYDFGVVSFDAVGHGESEGKSTNLIEYVEIIQAIEKEYGDLYAMIGHSFGFMAAVNAINQGVKCKKLVSIGAPAEFHLLLKYFSSYLGLSVKATDLLEKFVIHKFGISSFDEISTTGIAPAMRIPLLLIHDKNDDRVPLSQSLQVEKLWPGAKLHETGQLGHVRILVDKHVIDKCLSFVREES